MDENVYTGKLFQVIRRKEKKHFEVNGKDIEKELQYELVRRPPGVRALLVQNDKILLNREYRYELEGWDYRLPGGKVFDSINEYLTAINMGQLRLAVEKQLITELIEEADVQAINFDLIEITHNGFTIEWDLYYFLVDSFKVLPSFYDKNIKKSEYEYIEHCWMSFEDVYELCMDGKISEKNSSFIVMKYLLENHLESIKRKILFIGDEKIEG